MAAVQVGEIGAELNLLIKQGSDFQLSFQAKNTTTLVPINVTGSTIQAHLRKTPSAALTVAFTCTITDAVNGIFILSLTAAQTRLIKAMEDPKSTGNKYVWDLEMVGSGGFVTPLAYGDVMIFREVTR